MRRRIVLLLGVAGLGGFAAQPAVAAELLVKPAANRYGSGRTAFGYTVNPGGRVDDGVVVVNHGSTPGHITLHGAGAWVHLQREDFTVKPGESIVVPFTVTPPRNAAPGDHVGAIQGIPIRLRVSGALKPGLSAEHVKVNYSGGDATVTYTIHNTGNAILRARQSVTVSGPFGRFAARAGKLADAPPLLPGGRRAVSVRVRGVTPALLLTATVTMIPLLPDAAGSISPLAATRTTGHGLAVPWLPLAAVVLLVASAAALLRRHNRRGYVVSRA